MDDLQGFETTNINSKWLDNLFDNIVKLENHERLARNGVTSTEEYLGILANHKLEDVRVMLCDVQYKNLDNFVGEILITLKELGEIIPEDDLESLERKAEELRKHIKNRNLFINEIYSAGQNKVTRAELTQIYYQTLEEVAHIRKEILKGLASIRHVASKKEKSTPILR